MLIFETSFQKEGIVLHILLSYFHEVSNSLCQFSVQTTRRSNLALAGRRLNRIFMDSYNKFSRLTLKKWENKN